MYNVLLTCCTQITPDTRHETVVSHVSCHATWMDFFSHHTSHTYIYITRNETQPNKYQEKHRKYKWIGILLYICRQEGINTCILAYLPTCLLAWTYLDLATCLCHLESTHSICTIICHPGETGRGENPKLLGWLVWMYSSHNLGNAIEWLVIVIIYIYIQL